MRKIFVLLTLLLAMASCTSADVETWRMMEMAFTADTDYSSTGADAIRMDVQFVHKKTGKWDWTSTCPQDASLAGLEWFNPRTGETMPAVEATVKADGSLVLPQRPDVEDWTLTVLI